MHASSSAPNAHTATVTNDGCTTRTPRCAAGRAEAQCNVGLAITGGDRASDRAVRLAALVVALRPMFLQHGATIPAKVRVSCGWPRGARGKQKAIGQAWSPICSADGTCETFVSPVLADPVEVAAVMVHECVHHAVGVKEGHKGPFRRVAVALGLQGKMTATVAGDALKQSLAALCEQLGPYPHAALSAMDGAVKKQSTRMLKVACGACGCVVRMARQWLDNAGAPTCACGTSMAEVSS